MSQEDQRYALAAAAAAAAYAKKQARDEARKALIISTALNQNMSSLDPKTQEDLRQLLQAEARRVKQENFEWELGWAILLVIGLGFILLVVIGGIAGSSVNRSYDTAATPSSSPDATAAPTPTPEATATPIEVRRAEPVEVRRATPVSLRQAEHELQKAWDALPASKQAALRAEEREWWHRKDRLTGAAKLQMIQERTAYLLNQS
jgi:hypothetical protein